VAISIERFLDALKRLALLPSEQLAAIEDAVPLAERTHDADELARRLVREGQLTRFQAAAIYQDKADGLMLGNYLILDRLGSGGMGQVFRARHRRMDRVVAVKVLQKKSVDSPEAIARFQREMKAAAKLAHPNIVTAHDADEAAGLHFLVMEYVAGSDLAQVVKDQGPMAVGQALNCVLQAARGLAHAHAKGVVHRDIKPSNLLLDSEGVVKILDMGLARLSDPLADPHAVEGQNLTHSGSIMGTIDYMAPEQAMDSRQADARSDIYGLGCTLHFLLTGRPPYGGDTILKRLTAHQQAAIPALSASRPEIPAVLQTAFSRMVAKQPAARYQSMTETVAALEACVAGSESALAILPEAVMPLPAAIAVAIKPSSDVSNFESIRLPDGGRQRRGPRKATSKKPLAIGAAILLLATGAAIAIVSRPGDEAPQVVQTALEEPGSSSKPVTASPVDTRASSEAPAATSPEPLAAETQSVTLSAKPPVPTPPLSVKVAEPAPVTPASVPAPAVQAPEVASTPSGAAPRTVAMAPEGANAAPADGKLPIPTAAAQGQAERLVNDVFKDDYALAKQVDGKLALGKKLLAEAQKTADDPASRYVMLREARKLAIEAADPALAESAIGILASHFALDPLKDLAAALEDMAGKSHPAAANKSIAEAATSRVEEALATDEFDAARRFADVAVAAARKAKDAQSVKQAVELSKAVTAAAQQHEAWQKAQAKLRESPDDPEANLSVGRYLCLVQGDWPQGLPYLAKGTSGPLQELAAKSLSPPGDAAALADLGDAWWTAADKRKGKDKADLRAGAAYWYSQAEAGLTGLAKTRVEKRLAELGGKVAAARSAANGKSLPGTLDVPLAPGVAIRLRLIPAGKFTMGSPAVEAGMRQADEQQHEVTISMPFYMGVTEVTQAQWQAVMGNHRSSFQGPPERPVELVSWNECQQFIERLNESPGGQSLRFRLPTEAEWEYACRSGTTTNHSFGDDFSVLPDYAWLKMSSGGTTHAVGELKPNPWGLYDMHGNVFEWCADWYEDYPTSPQVDPLGPASGKDRSLRGGSYNNSPGVHRSARRDHQLPDYRNQNIGFRLVCQAAAGRTARNKSGPAGGSSSRPVRASPARGSAGLAIAPFTADEAKGHQQRWSVSLSTPVTMTNSIGMKLVLIPPGEFMMGSPPDEIDELNRKHSATVDPAQALVNGNHPQGITSEGPEHRVRISHAYYFGMYEVTQDNYSTVMEQNPSAFASTGTRKDAVVGQNTGSFPVESLRWAQANAFCERLSASREEQAAGHIYRLPTEAEWEYACRAGSTTQWHFGDDETDLPRYAWYKEYNSTIHAVGGKLPNPFGLFDIYGNANEWCLDAFAPETYQKARPVDPEGPVSGEQYVTRGGAFPLLGYQCRSAYRGFYPKYESYPYRGFRVVCITAKMQSRAR
jgi:formylglycine-generating enzyme required for sulfatase activity/serine/threonine protein kinase